VKLVYLFARLKKSLLEKMVENQIKTDKMYYAIKSARAKHFIESARAKHLAAGKR